MMKKSIYVSTVSAIALLTPVVANAAIDEMVVSAERREEGIQSVPVAVSAFDADFLETLQINSPVDLGSSVPNLQTTAITANATAIQVHMRGASVQTPGFTTSESPVGIYQDGVYRGRLATANLDFTDVERIEVLRGPQGTLYGRNTIAGAINIVSKTPGDDLWADASFGFGSYDTVKLRGSLGGPISEGNLAASASVIYHNRDDGYIRNAALNEDVGEFENIAGRVKLHYYGHDAIDAVLSVWAFSSENDGWNGIPYGPDLFSPGFLGPSSTPTAGFYTQLTPLESQGDSEEIGVSLNLSWDITDNITLRSITGYSDTDDLFDFDLSGGYALGIPGLFVQSTSNNEQLTQEFLLQGNALDGTLEWQTGVYYLKEEGEQSYTTSATASVLIPAAPAGFYNLFFENTENETESYAVYAQATYNFTDRFALTGGLRWTREEKDFNYNVEDSLLITFDGTFNDIAFALEETYEDVSPKVTLDFQATDDLLLYATYAEGFQSGGFQGLCLGNPFCAMNTFGPQDVRSYEIGLKADLLDNRLRINGAVFHAQYDDIQQTALLGGAFPLQNVGEVDVTGVELEVVANPVEGLTIFGNVGYADDEYESLDPTSGAALAGATQLPGLPEWSGRVGFEYEHGFNNDMAISFGADYTYSDEYFSEVTNALLIDDYGRTNGFIALGNTDGRWEFRLEGRNLTDEEDNVSGIFGNGVNERTVLPPREWMFTAKVAY